MAEVFSVKFNTLSPTVNLTPKILNTKEMLECDLKLELMAIPDLKEAIEHCEAARDFVSRDLCKEILESEEEHVDWLETQLGLIEKVGIQNYQQSQITPSEE